MSRILICRKYATELPGLDKPPMPGARGQALFETVSAKAWAEWQALQTRLINELQLNMIDPEARKYLRTQMERFLDNEETDEAEGFTPESS